MGPNGRSHGYRCSFAVRIQFCSHKDINLTNGVSILVVFLLPSCYLNRVAINRLAASGSVTYFHLVIKRASEMYKSAV